MVTPLKPEKSKPRTVNLSNYTDVLEGKGDQSFPRETCIRCSNVDAVQTLSTLKLCQLYFDYSETNLSRSPHDPSRFYRLLGVGECLKSIAGQDSYHAQVGTCRSVIDRHARTCQSTTDRDPI